MAITKAAKKALRQSLRRKVVNLKKKRTLKDLLREINSLISGKSAEEAKKLLPQAYKLLDKAAKGGLIKKGNADRRKSRLARAIIKIQ